MTNSNGSGKNKDAGFTIIEVLIAIVILSILCFPIFGYFRSSSQVNALSKRRQRATLAAQTVMEEVIAVGSYDGYVELCGKPEYAALDYKVLGEDASGSIYYFSRLVEVDGNPFLAYIEMNYEDYKTVGAGIGAMYNEYEEPVPKSLNTAKSVVALERSQNEAAVSHFVNSIMGATEDSVRNGMKRTAILTLEESPSISSGSLNVKMVYKYEYDSQTYVSPDTLYDGLMNKDNFDHIYWFYTSWDADSDKLEIEDNLSNIVSSDLTYTLTIARQEESVDGSKTINASYYVDVDSTNPSRITGTNANVAVIVRSGTGVQTEDLVHIEKGKRISRVTVSIFPNGTTDFSNPNDALVTLDSAKGE